MTYELVYTKRAREDIEALDRVAQKRLASKLLHLAQNPDDVQFLVEIL